MIMSVGLTLERKHTQSRAIAHMALAAMCRTWTRYTLRRAIADVARMSDRDYRAFGLDKAEMLAALVRLRDELECDGAPAAGRRDDNANLAIVVTKRRRSCRPLLS